MRRKCDKCCCCGVSCPGNGKDEPGGCKYFVSISMMDEYDIDDKSSQEDFAEYLEDWRIYITDYDDDLII